MKSLFCFLILFASVHVFAGLVEPDSSKVCTVTNGWTLKVDYYWDGHPQGPGGMSGIVQINDWGKFPVMVAPDGSDVTTGTSHGPDRLSSIDIQFSIQSLILKTREMLPLGNYTSWTEFNMTCK